MALTLLALFLVGYVTLMLTREDFADYDDSQFTLSTLQGHDFPPPIWPEGGRFFPLGLQEFNLVGRFTHTVVGYHLLPIAQILILSWILLILDDELSITARATLTSAALIAPGILISFTGLIYPDRNVVFFLACLALFVRRFEQDHSSLWAMAAVICAQVMIYYKEPAFLLLWGFAAGRLLLRCRKAGQGGWDYNRLRDKESRLDLCLISLGVLFLLFYAAAMFPNPNMQYVDDSRRPAAEVVLGYMGLDLLVWLFVAFVAGRVCLILRRRVTPLPLWDGLAFGGVAYFAAYLYLGLLGSYYLAPVELIAVLYVGRFALQSWNQILSWRRAAMLILVIAILFQQVSLSTIYEFERKNVIHAKSEIAGVVEARYQSGAGSAQRLFFPFAEPYVIMEFAAYLNYRGVPVEGATAESDRANGVVMVGRSVMEDGPCVSFRSISCRAGREPEPGDLVIVLPDDVAPLADVSPYRDAGELLLSYQPRPRIPQSLYPLVRRLYVMSHLLPTEELPDRWLDASVSVWK